MWLGLTMPWYYQPPSHMEVSMRTMQLKELAQRVGGRLIHSSDSDAQTIGAVEICNALPLQDARPGCLTMADHTKQTQRLNESTAAAVMVSEALADCRLPMIVVDNLHAGFQQAIAILRPRREPADSVSAQHHPSAVIAPSAQVAQGTRLGPGVVVGENCVVGAGCVLHSGVQLLENCVIGEDCELFPHVTLYPETRIGDRVLIHAAAVLGAYGFGYHQRNGSHVRTAQLGWVEVGDDVEIGAATTIDRGTYGPTRIGDGTKIDNQVQIGHNCHIGKRNLICAQVGIAGSTSTGDNVVLAGQVGIADHLHLADNVQVGAQSGVINNVSEGAVLVGSPAAPRRQRFLEGAMIGRLPELRRELKAVQETVAQLSAAQNNSTSQEQAALRRSA